jgi:hypothetical protein
MTDKKKKKRKKTDTCLVSQMPGREESDAFAAH